MKKGKMFGGVCGGIGKYSPHW